MKYNLSGGLSWKLKDKSIFIFCLRGPNAPLKPLHIDTFSGKNKSGESLIETQFREGTEETIMTHENNIVIPDVFKNTNIEKNIVYRYSKISEKYDYLPDINNKEYIKTELKEPDVLPFLEDLYNTSYTISSENDITIELLRDLVFNIDKKELLNKYNIYDIEASFDNEIIHYNRPTVIIDIDKDEVNIIKNNNLMFKGDLKKALGYIKNEYSLNIDIPISTIKVQHRLKNLDFNYKNIIYDKDSVLESENISKEINY